MNLPAKRPDWLVPVVLSWLTARMLVATAYLTLRSASEDIGDGSTPFQLGEKLMAWDGGWYRDIALHGYDGIDPEGIRFFPAFPLMGRWLSPLFAGSETAALLVIANIAAIVVLIGVYKLMRFEFGDPDAARWAVWATALFPASFVMSWAYSEPLMLACVVFAMLFLRRREFLPAAVLGFVAGFARPLGALLALAALIEVWRARRDGDRRSVRQLAAIVAAPLGASLYVGWASLHFDDWLLPLTIQNDLRGDPSSPPQRIIEGIGEIFSEPVGDGLHLPFALGFIALAVLVVRWFPASYSAIAIATLIVALGAENLNSLERYGLNAFPLGLAAGYALWRFPIARPPAMALSGGLMVALTSLAWWGSYVP